VRTFFIKLIPPRPSFAQDLSALEASAMREHAAYWRAKMEEGTVLGFGPVAHPEGTYGIGVIETEDEAAARRFMEGDPAIRANLGLRYEVNPMPQGLLHPPFQGRT
jgi:uncharacterized protein YciI